MLNMICCLLAGKLSEDLLGGGGISLSFDCVDTSWILSALILMCFT